MVTSFSGASIGIGRSTTTNSTLANVAEVIIYPIGIADSEANKIESYLALKYGITLDQTTPQNYTLSNSAIAWDATSAGLINNDIAGIARDDISGLSQIKSQSINNTGDIIVNSVSGITTDLQSLVWANDTTATGTFTSTDAPSGYTRITREWQFQGKNGNIGSIKIAYPAASVPTGASGSLYLFVDTDGVFSA